MGACYSAPVRTAYTQAELDNIAENVSSRYGWDFSSMHTLRQAAPWDYVDHVTMYLRESDQVLDIGTGGGERLVELAPFFAHGLGVDVDPDMVDVARANAGRMPMGMTGSRSV